MSQPGRESDNRWLFLFCSLVVLLLSWLVRPESVRTWVDEQVATLRGESSLGSTGFTTVSTSDAAYGAIEPGKRITLYFPSRQHPGMLDAVEAPVSHAETPKQLASEVVSMLQSPPPESSYNPALPQGTRLLAMFIDQGRLIVDLSPEFLAAAPVSISEARLTLYALVNSLTSLPFADEVRLLIGGEERTSYFDSFDLTASYRFNPDLVTNRNSTGRTQ